MRTKSAFSTTLVGARGFDPENRDVQRPHLVTWIQTLDSGTIITSTTLPCSSHKTARQSQCRATEQWAHPTRPHSVSRVASDSRTIVLLVLTFLLELLERCPGERAADLEPLADDRGRDQLVTRHLLQQLVIRRLVEQNQVVQLVTHFSLRPLLQTSKQKSWNWVVETRIISGQQTLETRCHRIFREQNASRVARARVCARERAMF